ncbi:carboxymuconolactone decarboxylase family protein [Streptosporangiaceae bacterium NEAU-GS5]|nr:carboxymuconolactone decarboxylase family protein [Streptosporangiaceae bacterium NEAU-GS5]
MPHISLGNDAPGIVGLFLYRQETARPLSELAEFMLRGPNTLTAGERELIAAYVSRRNECDFCGASHSAFAAAQLDSGMPLVDLACDDPGTAPISPKMRALLAIAELVRRDGRSVTEEAVKAAREAGATDLELHDTVLIAAAFCMFNRYVDGLATFAPADAEHYAQSAELIVKHGYLAILP